MRRCSACAAETVAGRLSMTFDGRLLCATCFGAYLSAEADSRARGAVNFRRCRCGAEVGPHLRESIEPYQGGELNLEYFFQPDAYTCGACSRTFKVRHAVITYLIAASLGIIGATAYLAPPHMVEGPAGSPWSLVLVAGGVSVAAHDLFVRRRYPRVR